MDDTHCCTTELIIVRSTVEKVADRNQFRKKIPGHNYDTAAEL